MGCQREYRCDDCGYTAMVAGGEDVGFASIFTQTAVCERCRELVEVYIGNRHNKEQLAEPALRRNQPENEKRKYMACPKCRRKVKTLWQGSGPCPKCAAAMRATGHEIMWD